MADILYITKEEAELQLLQWKNYINSYLTSDVNRRTRITIGSNTFRHEHSFSDPKELFDLAIEQRDILQKYLANLNASSTDTPVFSKHSNIPLLYKR